METTGPLEETQVSTLTTELDDTMADLPIVEGPISSQDLSSNASVPEDYDERETGAHGEPLQSSTGKMDTNAQLVLPAPPIDREASTERGIVPLEDPGSSSNRRGRPITVFPGQTEVLRMAGEIEARVAKVRKGEQRMRYTNKYHGIIQTALVSKERHRGNSDESCVVVFDREVEEMHGLKIEETPPATYFYESLGIVRQDLNYLEGRFTGQYIFMNVRRLDSEEQPYITQPATTAEDAVRGVREPICCKVIVIAEKETPRQGNERAKRARQQSPVKQLTAIPQHYDSDEEL